jgi:hypothetical protein
MNCLSAHTEALQVLVREITKQNRVAIHINANSTLRIFASNRASWSCHEEVGFNLFNRTRDKELLLLGQMQEDGRFFDGGIVPRTTVNFFCPFWESWKKNENS